MEVQEFDFGLPGRSSDDEGFVQLGTQFVFADGANVLLAVRYQSSPTEVIFVGRLMHGVERAFPGVPYSDSLFQRAVRELTTNDGVECVKVMIGRPMLVDLEELRRA